MTVLLDQRDDGSLALYIDGDLQFDSRDERVYHEALALPALALAERRLAGPLRALVCGGGDGLTARELLKSPRLARLDLVDYDPTILDLARTAFVGLNDDSLGHPHTWVVTDDAWSFVERAVHAGTTYGVIVVDLTLPQDSQGARFHTVEWYQRLGRLLGTAGLLAVNGVSPTARPDAYWSIYNSLRAAGLPARAYRLALPSFAARGYGDDWGFFLASPRPIAAAELDDDLPLATPRQALHNPAHLRRLFALPAESAARRATARPTRLGSDLFIQYLYGTDAGGPAAGPLWEGLAAADDPAPLPPADAGQAVLPLPVRDALAGPIGARVDEEALFARVLDLMPGLQPFQTRQMVASFLEAPATFLASIDLPGLVERLLRRAADLPRRLVVELRRLRVRLRDFAGDYEGLLRLGMRVVTVVTLVVIVANLLSPDTVYGKGSSPTSSGGALASDADNLSRTSRSNYDPRAVAPDVATSDGFRRSNLGRGAAVDELGTVYPSRRYVYVSSIHGRSGYAAHRQGAHAGQPPVIDESAYRLTPEADILSDGKVVILLTDQAYLLLGQEVDVVVDQQSGQPLLYLAPEPALHWRAGKEIERQRQGLERTAAAKRAWIAWLSWLEFAHWRADDQGELANIEAMAHRLEQARQQLGPLPDAPPSLPLPPVSGAVEVFSNVWMLPDGSGLALRQPDGVVYLDGQGWYRDQARRQPLAEPYPSGFRSVAITYLSARLRDRDATRARLDNDIRLLETELAELARDKAEYETIGRTEPNSTMVEYGSEEIPLHEALRRTNDDLARVQQRLAMLQQQRNQLPNELALAERAVATLAR